jgi:arylsulfatase A-like enzyme
MDIVDPLTWRRSLGPVALVCLWACAPAWGQPSSPNIVFILADDMGFGDTGITGQNERAAQQLPSFATPNLDALALSGVQFNNMYAGGTVCTPSRSTLMTGFHSGHTIVDRGDLNTLRAGNQDRTWGQILQDAGYETGMFGKWHLGGFPLPGIHHALPTQKGFETAYGPMSGTYRSATHFQSNGSGGMQAVQVPSEPTWPGPGGPFVYGEDLVANRATQFIRDKSALGQPFAAYVAFIEPHTVHEMVPQDHPYVNMPWSKGLRDYAGLMHKLDQHVGQIMQAIDDPNGDGSTSDSVANNTLLVFTSDNGPVWPGASAGFDPEFFDSNGDYKFHKWTTQEGGVRTPFFARWAGTIAPGTVNESYVGSFADILPTLAELSGQDAPLGIDGRSMLSDLVGGPPTDRRDVTFWATERNTFAGQPLNHSVRVGDWKLSVISPIDAASQISAFPATPFRLFNVASDPSETTNLLSARPDIVNALRTIMIAEGGLREPTAPWFTTNPNNVQFIPETINTYFTQYKTWAPQEASTDFYAAGNWSGGTQRWINDPPPNYPEMPDAQNWNTGPADNWLATMNNATGAPQQVALGVDASVLAMELGGVSTMSLDVSQGVKLSARNGLRISSGGILKLHDGEINTIRDVDVRPGGRLEGEGLVNGQQAVLAGIPEFAGLHLLEPRLLNRGAVSVHAPSLEAGRLLVQGDYTQESDGRLELDMYTDGVPGLDFDQLAVTGDVTLAGTLEISAPNLLLFQAGNVFEIVTIGGVRRGVFNHLLAPELPGDLHWALQYTSNAVLLGVVQGAGSGGPFDYLTRFNQSFGVDDGADLDGDHDTDGLDFLAWQRGALSAESGPASSAVPEPGSVVVMALGAIVALPMLRRGVRGRMPTRR